MIREARKYADQDKERAELVNAQLALDNYIFTTLKFIHPDNHLIKSLSFRDKKIIENTLKDAKKWLRSNTKAEKSEYNKKLAEIQIICDPILEKVYKMAHLGQTQYDEL
jgi:heat shock protein 5